jgi:sortase A
MKVVLNQTALRRLLNLAQGLLFSSALVLLGYGGFVILDAWVFERWESAALTQFVPHAAPGLPSVTASGLIGRMEVARLGVNAVVIEGTSNKTLRRAVGHIAGTALPGEAGNVGIAGHRDTFFRPLRNIQRDDIITVTTLRGEYRYRVVSTRIVDPSDVAVLDSDGSEILTLVTCYPFYFVGSAPDRFIVRARRIT